MRRALLNVMYTDPANFPPTINACRVQAAAGFEVHLVGFYRGQHEGFTAGPGIQEHYLNVAPGEYRSRVPHRLYDLWRLRRTLVELARRTSPAAIVVYDVHSFWAALPLAGRFRVLFHVHDLPPDQGLGRLDSLLHRFAVSRLDRMAAIVMPHAARLALWRERWGFRAPGFTVANCADRPAPAATGALRGLIGLGSEPQLLVRAGGGGPAHMLEESARSLGSLPQSWHLCLIGCGDAADRQRVRRSAEEAGVEGRVHHLEYVAYDRLRELLPDATVGLALYRLGSRNLNLAHASTASVKLMEYFAAGVPAIANDASDFRQLASETGAIEILGSESPDALSRAVMSVTEPTRLAVMRVRAREAFQARYNYPAQYQPVLRFIAGEVDGAAR